MDCGWEGLERLRKKNAMEGFFWSLYIRESETQDLVHGEDLGETAERKAFTMAG